MNNINDKKKAIGKGFWQVLPITIQKSKVGIQRLNALPNPTLGQYQHIPTLPNEISTSRSCVGRRKTATTNLKLVPGNGSIFVNGVLMDEFFVGRPDRILLIQRPFRILAHLIFDAKAKTHGGGFMRKAVSLQLALSRSILILQPKIRTVFRENGFLTCDSRTKERRKYGLKKSRKASQFSKR